MEKLPGALKAKGGMSDESDGDSHALHVIFSFLGLIVDVIRLTVEVVDKFYQKKHDDNKKD